MLTHLHVNELIDCIYIQHIKMLYCLACDCYHRNSDFNVKLGKTSRICIRSRSIKCCDNCVGGCNKPLEKLPFELYLELSRLQEFNNARDVISNARKSVESGEILRNVYAEIECIQRNLVWVKALEVNKAMP